ncbi:MAG: hypothetical protein IIZ63_09795 [Caulobacteraceae bacterium]|nr:hypothetical protein [Caulobacteraceae bacterium]
MSQDAATPTDPVILAAEQDAARENAKKAAAEAKTAAIGAQNASLQAQLGTFPDSGNSGKVDVKTDGGKAEAALLAGRATNIAAAQIVEAVKDKAAGRSVHVYAGADRPTTDRWTGFDLRQRVLASALAPKADDLDRRAQAALAEIKLGATPHAKAEAAPLAAVALGAATLTKILGLFQTDNEVGGVAVEHDDAQLALAVAGALRAAGPAPTAVYLAGRSTGTADPDTFDLIKPLAEQGAHAQARIAYLQERAKAVRADVKAKDPKLIEAAGACDQAVAAWQAVAGGYDALLTGLTTPDAGGALPAARVAAEKRLADALGGTDLVLFVKADASVGGYYVRKNILSVFGGEPFYVAAGVVASYVLVAGRQGDVLAAGVTPVHGGYVQASKAAEIVNAARPR